MPTNSPESMQLEGMLALCRSLVSRCGQRGRLTWRRPWSTPASWPERTGEGNAYSMGFGPTNVGLWRMAAAMEAGDHERAVSIAEGLNPQRAP